MQKWLKGAEKQTPIAALELQLSHGVLVQAGPI